LELITAFEHKQVLRAMCETDLADFVLEEIAASARISFERAWYAVLELIELRFLQPVGIGFYGLTAKGRQAAL
jgi:hypothetical protein